MHNSFSHDDPRLLWINADAPDVGCTGTFENPFSCLETALDRVRPGQTIVLMSGDYVGDCNIQKSGTPRSPVRICAEEPGKVTVTNACWFFYDTSDLIVSGISFRNASSGAISLIGTCNRNRFELLSFVDCGDRSESGCTMYMGGAGGGCNIIEECTFRMTGTLPPKKGGSNATVALMISQGDAEHNSPILNNVIRRNTFEGFDYAVIAGSDETHTVRCGHIIEYNRMNNCSREGIMVKCGDTTVKGNVLTSCAGNALTISSQLDCSITDNRIIDAGCAIALQGKGHTVANNCLIRCSITGIHVMNIPDALPGPAQNCFIERNSLIQLPPPASAATAILVDAGTSGILQQNLIAGKLKPYAIAGTRHTSSGSAAPETNFIIRDNGTTEGCSAAEGTLAVAPLFADAANDNFTTRESYGAHGWVVCPEGIDPHLDEQKGETNYRNSAYFEDDEGTMQIPGEDDPQDPFGRFFSDEASDETDENSEMRYWYPDADE